MRDFASSTLWRISTWHAALEGDAKHTAPGEVAGAAASSSLLMSLRQRQAQARDNDLLALLLVCLRQRQAVTLYMAHGDWVWPLSVFPATKLYHSPRDLSGLGALGAFSRLQLLGASEALLKEPGHSYGHGDASRARFRPLPPLLGELALQGPRGVLLSEISGRVAYRMASVAASELPALGGALSTAVSRLRRRASTFKDLARLPGMSEERASRLLNALYLSGALMVLRGRPALRFDFGGWFSPRERPH